MGDLMFKIFKKGRLKSAGKQTSQDKQKDSLDKSLQKNISLFKNIFQNDATLIIREFQNKHLKNAKCCVIYFDGMVNTEIVNENIIMPVLASDLSKDIVSKNLLEELKSKVIAANEVKLETDLNKIIGLILYGDTLFLLDGYSQGLIINTQGWPSRSIIEPESAKVNRGPREGFTESIMVNLSLLRRKINNPNLKLKFKEIGERTHTKTCICFIEGLARETIVRELERRLEEIKIDGILDSGYIQELIKDAPFSPFETVGATERPDAVAGKLLEGRVALFVDGSPFVLTVPFVAAENFDSVEDYYTNYITGSLDRMLRGFTAIITVVVPGLFLAVVTFHQEMLPTPLLISIASSRQDVPMPTSISLFVMLLLFDILRVSTTRMPANISIAVSIIGSTILGQAAVEARLVSAPVLIVTAVTGITALMNMNLLGASILFRSFILLGSSILGIYGFFICLTLLYLHVMSLRSFGVPYMIGLTRVKNYDGQDAWVRYPWWTVTLRPKIIGAKNIIRQSPTKKQV